jgi:hypothetical protein
MNNLRIILFKPNYFQPFEIKKIMKEANKELVFFFFLKLAPLQSVVD